MTHRSSGFVAPSASQPETGARVRPGPQQVRAPSAPSNASFRARHFPFTFGETRRGLRVSPTRLPAMPVLVTRKAPASVVLRSQRVRAIAEKMLRSLEREGAEL